MSTAFDTFSSWARRTTTSFGELIALHTHPEAANDTSGLAYRLKHWPDLPCRARTAAVLRTLSVMSHRAVNRRWIAVTSKLSRTEVDSLLARLVAQDAVTITDLSHFPAVPGARALG